MFTPLVFDDVSFSWPDGTPALQRISAVFGSGSTGLIGRNGSGKSTLLRLAAGELQPTSGRVLASGSVATLHQRLTLQTDQSVASLLGVADVLAALSALEAGDVSASHFDTIGDDWDAQARAEAALADAGLSPDMLWRTVGELSGGEAVLAAVAGLRATRADITLMDEPTNNLDRDARNRLLALLGRWPGTLIVVSHDTALLEVMENTAELYANELTVFGGGYAEFKAWLDAEQEAAKQAERSAASAVRREKRERIQTETKLAHRQRDAKRAVRENRVPPIVAGGKKMAAEKSAGKLRGEMQGRLDAARANHDAAERRIRDDESIHIELPDPQVPPGRRIATLSDGERDFILQGPERTALVGRNGVGKTTLLRRLLGSEAGAWRWQLTATAHTDRIGYLSQRLDGLDDVRSASEQVADVASHLADRERLNLLAKFLIRGDAAHRPVGTLSGGERFRVALARVLLAKPSAQLLVLDEPTNNLDLDTVDQLVDALSAFRGAVLLTSHDDAFLRRIGITSTIRITDDGTLVAETV